MDDERKKTIAVGVIVALVVVAVAVIGYLVLGRADNANVVKKLPPPPAGQPAGKKAMIMHDEGKFKAQRGGSGS